MINDRTSAFGKSISTREWQLWAQSRHDRDWPIAECRVYATEMGIADIDRQPVRRSWKRRLSKAGVVKLEVDGVAVKIGSAADAGVIAAVIEAVKEMR